MSLNDVFEKFYTVELKARISKVRMLKGFVFDQNGIVTLELKPGEYKAGDLLVSYDGKIFEPAAMISLYSAKWVGVLARSVNTETDEFGEMAPGYLYGGLDFTKIRLEGKNLSEYSASDQHDISKCLQAHKFMRIPAGRKV